MSLSVRFVASEADIPASLWQASFPAPLEGQWWYQTLEQSGLEDQFEFAYAVIQAGDEAVGIAPTFIMNVPMELVVPSALMPVVKILRNVFPSVLVQRTLFVGSPCSDEGTLGLLPGVDIPDALTCVQYALEARARDHGVRMIVWKDFPDSYNAVFEPAIRKHGLFRLTSYPGTVVPLRSSNKDDYFATLASWHRHNLRKRLRRSYERLETKMEIVRAPDPITLDEMFALFWQTYTRATTKFERLNHRFFNVIARASCSHFLILREKTTGNMVAFMLCFHIGERVINKFIGIDYMKPREWMLYFRLWEGALDWALSLHATSLQSGQTGYRPKLETGHQLIPLTNYCKHRNRFTHAIYKAGARIVNWGTLDKELAKFSSGDIKPRV